MATLRHTNQSPARPQAGTARSVRRRVDSPEHIQQKSLVDWLGLAATRYAILRRVYKIPNEALRSKLERHLVLSEGLRKGVLDLHLPVARQGYIGWWAEFKAGRGKLTPEQLDWAAFLKAEGHHVCEYRSWQVAAQSLIEYLALPITIDDIPLPHRKNV